MNPVLPSKDMLLEACTGAVVLPHPVLLATERLARLHHERAVARGGDCSGIDCARAEHVRSIDRWVAAHAPRPFGAAHMHTETVGMVCDRAAQFSADAHASLARHAPEYEVHYCWQRLAELSLGYTDLAFAISRRTHRLPDFAAISDGGADHG